MSESDKENFNPAPSSGKVPTSKRIAYAAPAFALAVVGIPIYVYIPKFYSDVVGVHIGILGTIILVIRLFDAITDPAIGFISDRTQSRFGRRRPYIAFGSVLLALAIYFLFNPLSGSPTFETAWFGVWFFMIFLFWTLVAVPYESMGPELTFDYNERTAIFGIRDGALIAGTLLAASHCHGRIWSGCNSCRRKSKILLDICIIQSHGSRFCMVVCAGHSGTGNPHTNF